MKIIVGGVYITVLVARWRCCRVLPAVTSHWRVFLDSTEEDGVLHRSVCLLTSSAILSEANEVIYASWTIYIYNAQCVHSKRSHLSSLYSPIFVLAE